MRSPQFGGPLRWPSFLDIAFGLRVDVGTVGEAATTHRMGSRPRIRFVFAHAFSARALGAASREIQLGSPGVADFRREDGVVLDTTEHYHPVLILIFHNLPG